MLNNFPPKKTTAPSKMNFIKNNNIHGFPNKKNESINELKKNIVIKNIKKAGASFKFTFEFEDHLTL